MSHERFKVKNSDEFISLRRRNFSADEANALGVIGAQLVLGSVASYMIYREFIMFRRYIKKRVREITSGKDIKE